MASGFRRKQLRPLHALATLIHFQPRRWEGNDVRSRRRLPRRGLLRQLVEGQNEFEWLFKPITPVLIMNRINHQNRLVK